MRAFILFVAGILAFSSAFATAAPGSWYQPIDDTDRAKGVSDLMYASSHGDVERVRELLAAKENPNQTDKDGWTSLHYACLGGEAPGWPKEMSRLEVIKLLVAAGANVNALAGASSSGSKDTALSMAAAIGQVDWVRFLLASGADPNIPGAMGPIIPMTAMTGHTDRDAAEVITLLANAGGDINAKNWRGETAMQVAKAENRPLVVQAIKKLSKNHKVTPKL
jgi:ankyrin repeat protein